MDRKEIESWIEKLASPTVSSEEEAWEVLKPLGVDLMPLFLEIYPKTRQWRGRVSMIFHAIKYARISEEAFELGILALEDKSKVVRYRACMLVAYSLRKDALPHLEKLLSYSDNETVENSKAAIDAIRTQNHHYFIDREHSGMKKWNVSAA